MSTKKKLQSIVVAALVTAIGLLGLKFLPMTVWGSDILFDASMHVASAMFVLFVLWYFVDQNKKWRLPYLSFSLAVIFIISMQRILADAHNDIGLLLGLGIGVVAIVVARWDYFKGRVSF